MLVVAVSHEGAGAPVTRRNARTGVFDAAAVHAAAVAAGVLRGKRTRKARLQRAVIDDDDAVCARVDVVQAV